MVKVYTPINGSDVPAAIKQLLKDRTLAKANNDYTLADHIRAKVKDLGYQLNDDSSGGTQVLRLGDSDKKLAKQYLVLFGSGETAPSSVDIYRSTFLSLGKRDLNVGLITTPAGFQPNVMKVYGDIQDFLLASLPDFNLNIKIIPINNRLDAGTIELVDQIRDCDIIMLGPGSPTYCIKHLKNTIALQTIIDQVKKRININTRFRRDHLFFPTLPAHLRDLQSRGGSSLGRRARSISPNLSRALGHPSL